MFVLFFCVSIFFFFNDTATTEIYTLSLHDALPICSTAALTTRAAASQAMTCWVTATASGGTGFMSGGSRVCVFKRYYLYFSTSIPMLVFLICKMGVVIKEHLSHWTPVRIK